jgi:Zn-dependent peptidase ImmA (M78 family)
MLAHVLLLLADEDEAFPRQSSDHGAADKLAHELIMPSEIVVEQSGMWFNDYRYLARLFAVSEGAMLDRMRELSLVKKQGIIWDF